MILKCISQPTNEPVTIEDVANQCRIGDLTDEQASVNLFIAAVRQRAESVTRRALLTQTWELVLDAFPQYRDPIYLPLPPLQSVSSITYYDASGALLTMTSVGYRVISDADTAMILPAYGTEWPATLDDKAVVRVRFVCGYGGDPADVPAAIRQWMLLQVANLFENRETETVASGKLTLVDLSTLADGLLDNYRVVTW